MLNRYDIVRCSLATFLAPALMIVWGCSNDDGLAKRYPVSGTVSYNGQPLAKGRINFVSKDTTARSASGAIENGSFFVAHDVGQWRRCSAG